MTCPSCNKEATNFFRHAFTLQGVSVLKSMQGYLTCQHCGTLLRVTIFKKQLWIFFITAVTAMLIFAFNYRTYIPKFGFDNMATIWITIIIALFFIFTIGIRKYSNVEKVEK